MPILLYIGLLIGAQAFQAVPRLHAIAVVAAILPNLAQWAHGLIDNALKYSTPAGLPVSASLMWAPGEAAGGNSGRYLGGNVAYEQGPFFVGYGFQQRKSGSAAAPAANPSTSTSHALAVSFEVPTFRVGASVGRQECRHRRCAAAREAAASERECAHREIARARHAAAAHVQR